jgi:hypothetical protein
MEQECKEEVKGYLTDDYGNPSTMRVMSWLSFFACIITAGLVLIRPPQDPFTGLYIFSAFLLGAFVPKALQKFAEQPLRK